MFVTFVYDMAYLLPLLGGALLGLGRFFEIEDAGVWHFAVMLLAAVVCEIFRVVNSRGRLVMAVMGLLTAVSIAVLTEPGQRIELYNKCVPYINCVIMTLVCFVLMIFLVKFRKVRIILALLLTAGMITAAIMDIELHKLVVASAFFIIAAVMADIIQVRWKKSGYTDAGKHFVYILPFIFVMCIVVFAVPASEKAYDWGFVKRFASYLQEKYNEIAHGIVLSRSDDYFASVIGFSERGEVSGDSYKEPEEMIELVYENGFSTDVYLSGKHFDTFNGREWLVLNNSKIDDAMFDLIASRACANKYNTNVTDIMRTVKLQLEFKNQKTAYMFMPLKSLLTESQNKLKTLNQGGNRMFEKKMGYKTAYKLNYYKLNRNADNFIGFIRAEHELDTKTWDREAILYRNRDERLYTYEQYQQWKQMVFDWYGQKVELSSELRSYMDKIYEGAEDDFDKLVRIEALLKGFDYTNTPGELPARVNSPASFLDYFILHKREGFCSYYATAFVLLARAEGIPARYVQGYHVKSGNSNTTMVTSDMSHAWPEVYINDFGWLPFEPTPGYGRTVSWMTREEEQALKEKLKETAEEYIHDEYEPVDITAEEEEPEEEEEQETFDWRLIVFPAALGIVLIPLFKIIERLADRRRFRKKSQKDKIADICHRNMKLLGMSGYKMENGETLAEFGKRVMEKEETDLNNFIGEYELLSYSTVRDEEKSLCTVYEAYLELQLLFKKKHKFRYLLYKINNTSIRIRTIEE
ncbi:MAG: transglutaminase-like domain-containing protein [Lachnospiraceae bacterium]|nr:transglutaminase-like domain-containing protein [Lachnospiraceae bacterium]